MSEINELRALCKGKGINSLHKTADEMRALLAAAGQEETPARADRAETREQTGRRRRPPLGSPRLKLDYPSRPGYKRRWRNDVGGVIEDSLERGYTHVEEERDGRMMRVVRRVGTQEGGAPQMGYLMEIRQEFYDEDQAIKQAEVDKIDDAIFRRDQASVEGIEPGKAYTPAEGVSVKVDT